MRSRERVVEIIETLGEASGAPAIIVLSLAADIISGDHTIDQVMRTSLSHLAEKHGSPHIRELATEALFYLRQDNV